MFSRDSFKQQLAHCKSPACAGQRRLLRLLQKLQFAESHRHAELLAAVAAASPATAAALLDVLHVNLEPSASLRWLATVTSLGQLITCAGGHTCRLIKQAARSVYRHGSVMTAGPGRTHAV